MTFAKYIGRGIGRTAATVVHASCVSASYTGEFGRDLLDNTVSGYVDNAERLAAQRANRPARKIAIDTIAMPAALKTKLAKA